MSRGILSRRSCRCLKLLALLTAVLCVSKLAKAAEFEDLGALGAGNSISRNVSADGRIVVGETVIAGGNTHAFSYANGTMTDIGTLGGSDSYALGISADGTVTVGYSDIAGDAVSRAFKYIGGVMTDLGTLGGSGSAAWDASSDGSVIVGESWTTGDAGIHAFRYAGGSMTDLGTLGGTLSTAYAVSADGSTIAGYSAVAGGDRHAFRHSGGVMTDIGTLGGSNAYAMAVSDDGAVLAGYSAITGNTAVHAFEYSGGSMTDIGTLGGTVSRARGISGDGRVIVGESNIPGDAVSHAFKYVSGTMTDIGTLGGSGSVARAVSSDGSVIVGESQTAGDSAWHAFAYRTQMTDVDNTKTAIANNGRQLDSLLNLKNFLLAQSLDYDCGFYDKRGICLSVSGWHYAGNETANAAQTASTLKAGYRLSPRLRAGLFVDLVFSSTNPDNFDAKKTPLFGGFVVLGDNGSGLGPQLKLSGASNEADVSITRSVLSNTEAGKGDSTFCSTGFQGEASYGFKTGSGWSAIPYAGLRWTEVLRRAYTETAGAAFPVTYNKITQKQTTVLLGVRAKRQLSEAFGFEAGGGLEYDISSDLNGYSGTIDTLGAFEQDAPAVTKARAVGGLTAYYNLSGTQRLGVGVSLRRQALENVSGTIVSGQYSIAF
ncbi:MAG: autotransporter domain-containing protein [Elusimicrobiaceae bacterium]|nr:autotransporter domain-containing protein [Elusimicrobiaceae bacterium]